MPRVLYHAKWPATRLCVAALGCLAVLFGGSTHAQAAAARPTARSLRQAADSTTTHIIADGSGEWHLVDSNATEATPATVAPANATTSAQSSASGARSVQLDAQSDTSGASTSTSSGAGATATHHRTPMTGYIVVGAMAIVCVGVAAGIAKKKRDAAGAGGGH